MWSVTLTVYITHNLEPVLRMSCSYSHDALTGVIVVLYVLLFSHASVPSPADVTRKFQSVFLGNSCDT